MSDSAGILAFSPKSAVLIFSLWESLSWLVQYQAQYQCIYICLKVGSQASLPAGLSRPSQLAFQVLFPSATARLSLHCCFIGLVLIISTRLSVSSLVCLQICLSILFLEYALENTYLIMLLPALNPSKGFHSVFPLLVCPIHENIWSMHCQNKYS